MHYRIEVYENLLDEMPIVSAVVDNTLEAEAAIRTLTEKAEKKLEDDRA